MANTLEILIQAKDEASKQVEGVSKSLDGMSKQLKIAGAAMTAVGVAGLKMVADAKKLNAELGQTAITLGVTTKEMRDLALATTDVTFQLGSVIATFDLLARAGMRNTDEMQKSAKAFDALADATGTSAEVVADLLIPAFKLFGESIPQTSQEMDRFTWLVKRTTVDLSDFGTLLTRMAPYMDELNLSMGDAIAMLAALSEKGIQGTAATLALRTAITQAASSGESLNDILGITQDQLALYRTEMEGATGITDEYAEAANTQYGIMDKLKQKFQEITFAAGSFLEPLEPILALMTALGPVMILFSMGQHKVLISTLLATKALIAKTAALVGLKTALIAATAKQWALNAAMLANPIGLIIAAIAGLIVATIKLFQNWEKLSEPLRNTFAALLGPAGGIVKFLKEWDKVKDAFGKTADWLKTNWGKVGDFFKTIWNGIVDTFKGAANLVAGIINGLIGGFESFLNFFVNGLNFFINGINRIIAGINTILPGAIELAVIPTIESVKLGQVPLMDTGGLIKGPGLFEVGPGVTEIAREPSSGEVHIHVGYLLGDELSLSKFARLVKERIATDNRRTAFGPVNQGYYYGRSST